MRECVCLLAKNQGVSTLLAPVVAASSASERGGCLSQGCGAWVVDEWARHMSARISLPEPLCIAVWVEFELKEKTPLLRQAFVRQQNHRVHCCCFFLLSF